MKAYHFLKLNMETGLGTEGPWVIGEEREIAGEPELCYRGYHSSKSWLDALNYAPGAMACIVDIPTKRGGTIVGDDKQVSPRRKLLAARDATQVLQLFACDCAERALKVAGVTDERLWAVTRVARLYINGEVGEEELKAARVAYAATDPYFAVDDVNATNTVYTAIRAAAARAYADARAVRAADATARAAYAAAADAKTARAARAYTDAARAAANAADAAVYAARANAARAATAANATRVEERAWQRRRLNWYMKKLFEEV